MSSFYDILKAAKVGGNLPSYYETLLARKMPCSKYAWTETTLTGIPPISFRAKGTPLTAYSIIGNETQTGTPTADAPITPEECGDRTANLVKNDGVSVEYRGVKYTVNPDKSITAFGTATSGVSYFIFAGDGAAENSINSYNTPIFKAGETLVFSTNSQNTN